jgi:hypothetical protein
MTMKTIYQNYNLVREGISRNRRIVKKTFKERFCWENETKVLGILRGYGFAVPEIIESSPFENTYSFFDMPLFAKVLKSKPESIDSLLDLLSALQKVNDPLLHRFDGRAQRLLEITQSLYLHERISKAALENIQRICGMYNPQCRIFCHGDFRPDNFFFQDGVGGMIDFEFSGIDDPNKDLAYLWVGAVRVNKGLNHRLKKCYTLLRYFDDSAFLFWLTYVHSMVLRNPLTRDQVGWASNLEKIVQQV